MPGDRCRFAIRMITQDSVVPGCLKMGMRLSCLGRITRPLPQAVLTCKCRFERMGKQRTPDKGEKHIERVRRICLALPETMEKLSHGEPTFFVKKKVFAMCSINHHNDGHIAVVCDRCPARVDRGVAEEILPAALRWRGRLGRRRASTRQRQRLENASARGVAIDRTRKIAKYGLGIDRRIRKNRDGLNTEVSCSTW